MGFEPQGWDLGLETGIWALWGEAGGYKGGGGGEGGGDISAYVKAWVIDPFGAAAQKQHIKYVAKCEYCAIRQRVND